MISQRSFPSDWSSNWRLGSHLATSSPTASQLPVRLPQPLPQYSPYSDCSPLCVAPIKRPPSPASSRPVASPSPVLRAAERVTRTSALAQAIAVFTPDRCPGLRAPPSYPNALRRKYHRGSSVCGENNHNACRCCFFPCLKYQYTNIRSNAVHPSTFISKNPHLKSPLMMPPTRA